jgi:hypothetical protein
MIIIKMKTEIRLINFLVLTLIFLAHNVFSLNEKRVVYLSVDDNSRQFMFDYRGAKFVLTTGLYEKDMNFLFILEKIPQCNGLYALKSATSSKFIHFGLCSKNTAPVLEDKPSCYKYDEENNLLRNIHNQPVFFKTYQNDKLCIFGIDDFLVNKVKVFEIKKSNKDYEKILKNIETFQNSFSTFKTNLRKNNSPLVSNQNTENFLKIFEALSMSSFN